MPKRDAIQEEGESSNECKKGNTTVKNWNDMPNEIKVMIMDNMDLITRTRLKMCSKSNKCLVEAFPMVVKTICAKHQYEPREPSTLKLYDREKIELRFSQYRDIIRIHKNENVRMIHYFKNRRHARKTMESYFYNILLAKHIRIEHFDTSWKLDESYIPAGHMFHFDSVNINIRDGKECVNWLKHIAPCVKEIRSDSECVAKEIGVLPCVLNAKSLQFNDTDINDEQLLSLKATRIILGKSNVTVDGVRKLIKKWIKEDYRVGSNFDISLPSTPIPTIEQFFDGEYSDPVSYGVTRKTMVEMGRNKLILFTINPCTSYFGVGVHILSKPSNFSLH